VPELCQTADHSKPTLTAEPIRISIGTEPKQFVPSEVLKHSIRRRASRPVEFVESWSPVSGWHPATDGTPKIKNGTAFNTWRWITPSLWPDGRAIYLDADQVVLADIAELWDALPEGKAIACVCHAVGFFGDKQPEPGKPQTSVMVMDIPTLLNRMWPNPIEMVADGLLAYRDLMQAAWLDRSLIAELPPEWNHFGIKRADTKLLHYSHVKSQPYRNPTHPTAWVFADELKAAVADGVLTRKQLKKEIAEGHLAAAFCD
jgi:hypothetical protein